MVEVVVTHVARTAMGVRHHHDLLNTQFVDRDDDASHSRIESRDDEASCVLDDFGITILQSECGGQELGETGVHAGEPSEFLVRVFVGELLLIAFLCDESLVESNDFVNHG